MQRRKTKLTWYYSWSSRAKRMLALSLITGAGLSHLAGSALAGTATFDFKNDPTLDSTLQIAGNNPEPWKSAGGKSDGFLAITYPVGSQYTGVIFPDIDQGKIVTSFKFDCDLRVGNSTGDRPADGFSISFARGNDPLLQDLANTGNFAGGIPEGGSTTGIAISFDTWAGNTFPDGPDIEGIIVRVDNVTVLRQSLPTRHGACDDITSLQTGPRNATYWADGGDPYAPESWTGLCWQPFSVELDDQARLTVRYKNNTILDKFQTSYFPTVGRLILAGRTGGANEHTHVDNIRLTTVATTADTTPPTAPGNFQAASAGARRVVLNWGAAMDDSGRVAYQLERNGQQISGLLTETTFTDLNVKPSTAYTYRVRATDVSQNGSPWVSVTANTVAEVDSIGFLLGEIYDNITGTAVLGLLDSPEYPNNPNRGRYLNGLSFGEPAFGGTFGDNFGIRITGVLTAPETANYNFFVRSDDASQFFLNINGPAIPSALAELPIAEETGCCNAFQEPGAAQTTFAPIPLQAGKEYGFLFIVKEGGGGDWGQVAMRKEGDTTPAAQLQPIRGAIVRGKADPVGAVVKITQAPQNTTVVANSPATMTVTAETASPYTTAVVYQWYRNGAIIPGANAASYSIPVVAASENGAKYKVLVAVPGASVTSDEITLTVQPDQTPPAIKSVVGSDTFTRATITFSEPVIAPSATTAANYSLSGGVTVTSAELVDPFTVRLTTSRQAEATNYTLTVNNVRDNANNAITANTTARLGSFVFTKGKMKYEAWSGITGVSLDGLKGDARYPASPSLTQLVDAYEAPIDRADNFGARISGWITPENTGSYVFFLSADDNAELYLSTDDTPANKKLIAVEPTWNGARQWVATTRRDATAPENRSSTYIATEWPSGNTINLTAGQRYYTELLYKEGGGGDNGAATWKLASAADPANGSPALSGSFIGTFAPPVSAPPVLSVVRNAQGAVTITYEGTLQGADQVSGPFTAVAGASSPYTIPPNTTIRFYRSSR